MFEVILMGKGGRPRRYKTRAALQRAVDGYFDAISFLKPVVVTTLTGEVDEEGLPKTQTRMLREGDNNSGKPKTTLTYFEPPSMEALCLRLGISRDTWASYGKTPELAPVVEEARLKKAAYLVGELSGKHVQGIIFDLKNNYGWVDRQEVTQTSVGMTVEEYLAQMDEREEGQEF